MTATTTIPSPGCAPTHPLALALRLADAYRRTECCRIAAELAPEPRVRRRRSVPVPLSIARRVSCSCRCRGACVLCDDMGLVPMPRRRVSR